MLTVFITLVLLNVVEIFLPIVLYKPPEADESEEGAAKAMKKMMQDPNSVIHDMQKDEHEMMMDEYMEIVLMWGYVLIFGVALPIAPFIAVCQNFIEVRVDAFKMTKFQKRGCCRMNTGIGVWFGILKTLTFLGMCTNLFILLQAMHPFTWTPF